LRKRRANVVLMVTQMITAAISVGNS